MTHLKIELDNGIIEEVSSTVISKLYDIVHSGNLDNTSNLVGRLHTSATYQDYIDYLEDTFKVNNVKLLIIDATRKYIRFADPEVTRVLASQYGDGIGITATDVLSITSLSSNLFANNTDITQFNELSLLNVTSLPLLCFYACTNLSSIDTSKITTFGESSLRSIAATTIDLSSATSLGDHLFEGNTALTSVTLDPNNVVTNLGASTFSGCLNLEGSFDLSNSTITQIKQGTFANCKKITSITLPSTVTSILGYSFLNCLLLNSINLLNVTTIGSESFSNTPLTTLDLSSLTLSGSRCFLNCTRLTSVTFDSPVNLAEYTFNGCTGLTTITGTNKITNIGNGAFQNCTNLETLEVSDTVTIGNNAFNGCTSLTSVDLSSITNLGLGAFKGCTLLSSLNRTTFSGITRLHAAVFKNCPALTGELSFPDLTELIYENALRGEQFNGCTNLTKISLGHLAALTHGYTASSDAPFKNCTNLKIVDLGDSLTSISDWNFVGCSNLKAIKLNVTTPPSKANGANSTALSTIFGNSDVDIYVPDAAVSTYLATSPYSNFADHIKPLSTYNETTILAS